jgi:hypothetical protein
MGSSIIGSILPIDKDFCDAETSHLSGVELFKCVCNLSRELLTVYWQKLPFYSFFPDILILVHSFLMSR